MKAIADIRVKIEHGATVEEINSAFESHQYPELENAESQMAMVRFICLIIMMFCINTRRYCPLEASRGNLGKERV